MCYFCCFIVENIHVYHFNYFKCTVEQHYIHLQYCITIIIIYIQNFFIVLQKILYPLNNNTPSPRTPSNNILLLLICLFQISNVSRIIRYLSFCIWLISLSTMVTRSMLQHTSNFHSLLWLNNILMKHTLHFVYQFI